jgi:hypothetical protein
MTREAERRPGARDGVQEAHAGSGTTAMVTRCPILRAALACSDLWVELAAAEFHPADRCAYRRRPRPIRFEDIPREDW